MIGVSVQCDERTRFQVVAVPDVAHLDAIRWRSGVGGESAARWIHLMAASALLYVVLPRAALALAATATATRLSLRAPIPASLAAYFRASFASVDGVMAKTSALIVPYACELSPGALARLIAWLPGAAGGPLEVNARASVAYGEEDRYLAALPLFHVHGLANGIHAWLVSGCHMKLVERFDQERAVAWFEQYKPTMFFGVPTMYVRLLDVPEERARAIGANTRLFVSGSAPLPAHVLDAFHTRYGHVILERYGMTETLMNISNPYSGERRPGTVGKPLPMVGVRILDEDGEPVADGASGELWVKGPNVCDGYWRRPEATAASWKDGWFRTGDIGVRANDGYITLEGRRSDLIISGGFNIYPREIEELLTEQPGVREASVVGVGDPVRGEVPVAYLVTDGEIDGARLEATLRTQLASFKIPRAYIRVDALPKTALGKVQKHLLPKWSGAR